MNVLSATGEALVLIGTFFYFLSTLGLIRMPDVYNRMQTSTKSATLGSLGVLVGTGFWAVGKGYSWAWIVQTLVVATFLLLTNPISAHALIRAAYKRGIPLWSGSVVDKYHEHLKKKEETVEEAPIEGDAE
ncbi:monovalent cation/H(+) antiporter subunit G [Thermococcus sp. Bubb.Bath]|uniref:monovalent cation/H(+) antiporter subunit G n=1 Tax=Thermococcus sp. Bubb.Bath TaxID=1638242 RepID=UPI001438A540|nr:monovalent cation/H(+) antiporter subunit G [Thermococcus sp. Bubb.Bath]NJF24078.1 Na+/H+ antiporter subunit G [Thermococcus sp. Bubb.Bath]